MELIMAEKVTFPKVDGQSKDIEAAEEEKLKALFPQCFSEGKLDIDKLLSLCGEYIDNDFEKYKFEWKGKSECYRIAGKRSTGTLRPCPEESVDFENTNNLYIEGDNLEVLKLLQTAYYRKVKMIYIDPPYNTGNDFVYEDDFKDPLAKYKEITSQTTKSNPETMGRYHTNWLNMMYPRLRLAANLLRDDGVIFISIDDYEVTNLCRLCDEVFGEENCLGQLIWSLSSGTQAGHFTRAHEYVLAYAKRKDALGYFEDKTGGIISHGALKQISPVNPASEVFFPKGSISCETSSVVFPNELGDSEKEYVVSGKLAFENSILSNDVTIKAGWAMKNQLLSWLEGKETFDSKGQKVTRFYFNSKGILFYEKERGTTHPKTVLTSDLVGNTKQGSDSIIDLFDNKIMDFPKPINLIKFLANLVSKDNDIILDFFSGSATTAHAVMALNTEDGGNRQFIMVQLPELTDEKSKAFKAGYKNICEIGKERIRRAGAKIKQDFVNDKSGVITPAVCRAMEKMELAAGHSDWEKEEKHNEASIASPSPKLDLGFKVLKLDTSNLIKWDDTPTDNEVDLFSRMDNMVESIKKDRSELDVIFEVMLKLGIPPTYKVNEITVNRRKVCSIGDDGLVLICLDGANGGITPEDITAMCDLVPAKIIAAEKAFKDDVALSNAYYISKDKGIEIELL